MSDENREGMELSRRAFGRLAAGTTLAAASPLVAEAQNMPKAEVAEIPERAGRNLQAATMRPEIVGKHGIVAAGRHYAVDAGMQILKAGGNAFDAGAAAVFAASVTEISHFGLGGEAVMIVYDAKSNSINTISGQGTAPSKATPSFYKDGFIPGNGPNGCTMPAVVDAVALLLQNYGTMSLSQVMAPAIDLADGFVMYEFLQGYFVSQRTATEKYEWSKSTYYPGGHVVETGELFRQPNLARTLRIISDTDRDTFAATKDRVKAIQAGRDTFYKGDIARRMGAALQKDGSLMSYDDLANYHGFVEKPETTNFYGYDIYKCSYWNQGPTLLMALNILEAANVRSMTPGTDLYIHTLIEAINLAYDDRNAYFGDPRFVKVPGEGLLSKVYAKSRAAMIAPTASLVQRVGDPYAFQAAKRPPGKRFLPHVLKGNAGKANDTTSIQIVDKDGNLFSCTPSSGWLSGGAYIAGDTGVPMSNRLTVFDLDPASPNVIAGGKRPRTTLTPSIIMKGGKPFFAIGTPGGDNQDQTLLQAMLNLLAFGIPLQASVEAPRATSLAFNNSFFLKEAMPGLVEIENRFDPAVRAKLEARGHKLKVIGPYESSSGVVAAGFDLVHNTLRGAADVRRERYAMGW